MDFIDFSKSKIINKYYGGSERKLCVEYQEKIYMLKFQKDTQFGKRNNHLSEYIGSHIFNICNVTSHSTILGTYKDENIVACLDFTNQSIKFVPFNEVGESTLETDKDQYQYSYEDIITLLKKNNKITKTNDIITNFFDMFIIDALIGNFDRHGSNWGFLKINNEYKMAPIFDNGSSLFPQMTDEDEMEKIINSEDEINERVYTFPTSQILLNNKKSSYYEVIYSLQFEEMNNALLRIYPRINMNYINNLINELNISNTHKKFYITMLEHRYNKIIKAAYDKLMEKNK